MNINVQQWRSVGCLEIVWHVGGREKESRIEDGHNFVLTYLSSDA